MVVHGRPFRVVVFAATAFGVALGAGSARAACNSIPDPPLAFRGSLGSVSAPFGRSDSPTPPPVPDPRDLEVGRNGCKSTSLEKQDYVVTVVFKPPQGSASIVALTTQADCAALACDTGASFHCVSGENAGILVNYPANKLRFRFPDTDALAPGDGRTLTGPALIAVGPASDPLPCKLAGQRCQDPGRPSRLFACVDELFKQASCGTGRGDLDPSAPHFTALPPLNDWQKLCKTKKPPCTDLGGELLLTVDSAGDALVPVSWAGVLPAGGGEREIDGGTTIPAETNPPNPPNPPIRVPSDRYLTSLPLQGQPPWPTPPLFKRHPVVRPGWFDLTGEVDKPESVLKIARRKLWEHECQGGPHAAEACESGIPDQCGAGACVLRATPSYFACVGGVQPEVPCANHQDCPGGKCLAGGKCIGIPTGVASATACHTDAGCADDQECGRGLFELRDRLAGGVGPIVVPPADYEAKVK